MPSTPAQIVEKFLGTVYDPIEALSSIIWYDINVPSIRFVQEGRVPVNTQNRIALIARSRDKLKRMTASAQANPIPIEEYLAVVISSEDAVEAFREAVTDLITAEAGAFRRYGHVRFPIVSLSDLGFLVIATERSWALRRRWYGYLAPGGAEFIIGPLIRLV